jgi:hypothetical protein
VLALPDQSATQFLGIAEIDLRSSGARRAEGEARKLQPRRGRFGHVADDVEGVVLGLIVILLVEDLQPIVDRADRTDHVVTDLAGNQSGQFKVRGRSALAHLMSPRLALSATKRTL